MVQTLAMLHHFPLSHPNLKCNLKKNNAKKQKEYFIVIKTSVIKKQNMVSKKFFKYEKEIAIYYFEYNHFVDYGFFL